jgi:hypothetical protein
VDVSLAAEGRHLQAHKEGSGYRKLFIHFNCLLQEVKKKIVSYAKIVILIVKIFKQLEFEIA